MEPNNLLSSASTITKSVKQDIENYFNNFYINTLSLPTDTDGAVQAYFESVTGDRDSARLLTAAVVYTSLAQGNNPMSVISDFKKVPKGELDIVLSTFLNLNRVNTSLLGIINQPRTGFFVRRSILA